MKGQLLTMMSVDKTLHDASPNETCLQRAGIVIPTYNANRHWESLQTALESQGIVKEQVLIVDSSSSDKTQEVGRRAGYRLTKGCQRNLPPLCNTPDGGRIYAVGRVSCPFDAGCHTLRRSFD